MVVCSGDMRRAQRTASIDLNGLDAAAIVAALEKRHYLLRSIKSMVVPAKTELTSPAGPREEEAAAGVVFRGGESHAQGVNPFGSDLVDILFRWGI